MFYFLFLYQDILFLNWEKFKKQSIKIQDKQGDFLSIIDETFNGMKVIKTFNADGVFKLRFKKAVEKYFSLSNKFIQKQAYQVLLVNFWEF